MIDFSAFRNRQWYILGSLLVCVFLGCLIFLALSMGNIPAQSQPVHKNSVVTGASRTNPQEAWVYQFKEEAELTNKRLNALEEILNKLLKMNGSAKALKGEHPSRYGHNSSSDLVQAQQNDGIPPAPEALVEELRSELKTQAGAPPANSAAPNPVGQVLPPAPGPSPERQQSVDPFKGIPTPITSANSFRSKTVRKITLSLKNARGSSPLKSVDNTIPAGAFARAILLGGVDASASIQASSDPRPALLRIMDPGTLPRAFRSDLQGCHALAACYGDISSERVFMRLEKLTCTERKTGEIVEVKVQGYVAGEDGRTGVRGSVVDRAGESMRNVLMGGFLGGIGEFLSQPHTAALTFSPMAGIGGLAQATQPNPMGVRDMLKHGAGKGINNALDKYADFYIKRAEQLQPVIQVAAGRQVDIVFTEGVSIGDSIYRQAIGRSHDQERYQQIQTTEEGPQKPVNGWIHSNTQRENQ
jgi:conjugal transfer pilus assembly protein TraB